MSEEFKQAEPFRSRQEAEYSSHRHLSQGFDDYFKEQKRQEDEALAKAGNPKATDFIEIEVAKRKAKEAEQAERTEELGRAVQSRLDERKERKNWLGDNSADANKKRALVEHEQRRANTWLG